MMLKASRLHKRIALVLLAVACLPFTFLLFKRDESNAHLEEELTAKIARLRQHVSQVEMMYQTLRRDLVLLTQHVNQFLPWNLSSDGNLPEVDRLLLDRKRSQILRLPNIFSFLPYLLNDPLSTVPASVLGQGKSNASVVLGIPTVKRESQMYLLQTLQNLIESMNEEEKNMTLIIVFVAETNIEYVTAITDKIKRQFGDALQNGLLEVISPPASFYPNLNEVRLTLDDTIDRVRWRTKQNLDYSFLIMYARSRGLYYVQLEDDILTTSLYITKMLRFALEKEYSKTDWFILDFCELGFIGKMFKSIDLPYVIQFAVMFHNDKPVDWLLDPIIETRYCPHDTEKCNEIKTQKWIHYKPSLFQHVGTNSSLKGKVQELKDMQFDGELPLFIPHSNPPARIKSPIKSYEQFTLERAYLGESFFWGMMPQAGDTILFQFDHPFSCESYRVRSGNFEHPSDLLYNTTVEVQPNDFMRASKMFTPTSDEFVKIGEFSDLGLAEGKIDSSLNPIAAVRLVIKSTSKNSVIINEIVFETSK